MNENASPAELADFPVVITLPILWGDQDAFGHVNNVIFFRWCESARIAYIEQTGIGEMFEQHQIGPILAAISCNYRRQLTYPDTVRIGARITRLGRSSMTVEHVIFSDQLGDIAADSTSTVVAFDYQAQRSAPIPDDVRKRIEETEGKDLSS